MPWYGEWHRRKFLADLFRLGREWSAVYEWRRHPSDPYNPMSEGIRGRVPQNPPYTLFRAEAEYRKKMSRNGQLPELLEGLPPQALQLFCLTCAERGRAFYESLASDEDVAFYNDLLDLAWSSAAGDADEDDVAETFEAAEERLASDLDEAGEEGGRFYAEQAGLLVLNALAAQLNPSIRAATMSSNTLETLLSHLDFILSGDQVRIREAGEPARPLGDLQRAGRDAQEVALVRLRAADAINLTTMRAEAGAANQQIVDAVTMAAERRGWFDEE